MNWQREWTNYTGRVFIIGCGVVRHYGTAIESEIDGWGECRMLIKFDEPINPEDTGATAKLKNEWWVCPADVQPVTPDQYMEAE